jgi:hypothetical protein
MRRSRPSCLALLCKYNSWLTETCQGLHPVIRLTNILTVLTHRTVLFTCSIRHGTPFPFVSPALWLPWSPMLFNNCSHKELKACHELSPHCFPFFSAKVQYRMSGCCWVITIYAIEQGARPCGTPHDFVAAEAKSLLLMMSCVNCAHHIWYLKLW